METKEGLLGFFLAYTLAEYFTAFFHSAGVNTQGWKGEMFMKSKAELSLKVTKEIVVKFIEIGRVTPGNFEENYERIFKTVRQSAKELS